MNEENNPNPVAATRRSASSDEENADFSTGPSHTIVPTAESPQFVPLSVVRLPPDPEEEKSRLEQSILFDPPIRPGSVDQQLVSVIVPVKNGMPYFAECLDSLLRQTLQGNGLNEQWDFDMRICIYNDGSTDDTEKTIQAYLPKFLERGVSVAYSGEDVSKGVGYAKNRACRMAVGKYLCFLDADDVAEPDRLEHMAAAAEIFVFKNSRTMCTKYLFMGSNFIREPADSTVRFTRWANNLEEDQLKVQIYTSHGPTLIAPTWFISRSLYEEVGGFFEQPKGYPEDLVFFYAALDVKGVQFMKIQEKLVRYRYHKECATFGVSEKIIWDIRVNRFREKVLSLPKWHTFSIWNAGKQGKQFLKSLTAEEQDRVTGFLDVDEKKLKHGSYEVYDEVERKVKRKIPIQHPKKAHPPVVICVKLDMTNGDLERMIGEFKWKEGKDYVLFS